MGSFRRNRSQKAGFHQTGGENRLRRGFADDSDVRRVENAGEIALPAAAKEAKAGAGEIMPLRWSERVFQPS